MTQITPVTSPRLVNVAGLTIAWLKGLGEETWHMFGSTRDGVVITPEAYFLDVKNDDHGGEAGPPAEVQYLGETARIRLELTKFDLALSERIEARLAGVGAPGTQPTISGGTTTGTTAASIPVSPVGNPGTLMFAGNQTWQLGLQFCGVPKYGTTTGSAIAEAGRLYPVVMPRHGVEINKGTKFSTFIVEFEAHAAFDGTLWCPWKAPTS